MQKFFNSIVRIDKSVIVLFWVSLAAIILMKLFPFISIYDDNYWNKIECIQEITTNICYSIIAGCVFYYFTVHLPLQRLREHMAFYLNNSLMSICGDIKKMAVILKMNDLSDFPDPFTLTESDVEKFKEINKKIFKVLAHKDLLENEMVYHISTISDYIEKIIEAIEENELQFHKQISGNMLNLAYNQSKKLADLTDKFRKNYGGTHVQKFDKEIFI